MDPGLRDELVTADLARIIAQFGEERVRIAPVEIGEARVRLARHLTDAAARLVGDIEDEDAVSSEVAAVNRTLAALSSPTADFHDMALDVPLTKLTGVFPRSDGLAPARLPEHPVIPLTDAELLSNAPGQPSLGHLVRQECASAHRVDLLCAFIGPSGVSTCLDALEDVVVRGRAAGIASPVRVITSTWLGATKREALDKLCAIGADVYAVYDGLRLRLHAKSWRFARHGGLATAYVGSSNLSHAALEHGLEWNVRLSERTNPGVIERIEHTFDAYLEDPQFERYHPERDAQRLDEALAAAGRRGAPRKLRASDAVTGLRPRPFAYQQRILDELHAARTRHDRHRNLVVAATGTGKTVIAAFDYARLTQQWGNGPLPSLLFVAHKEEILEQSRAAFRAVLGRPEFGELLAGGRAGPSGRHIFANIQSLHEGRLSDIDAAAYDIVIVDEFHHAAAPTYRRLLDALEPRELLGLTATPERTDGADITAFFGGRITTELRLWEAIDQGLLAPFQYYGVDDRTDLSAVRWTRGRYDAASLTTVLMESDTRVTGLLTAMDRYVPSVSSMRALGFCASREHGRYMSDQFNRRGIVSAYVDGDTPPSERRRVLDRLASPSDELRCVFSVDVLGEGVDVPDVDTILMLRPTESATVFLQQLGRGLRLAEGKDVLTVIDMVGVPHERFRFDRVLRTIIDPAGGGVLAQARQGFPYSPSGCDIYFERAAHDRVLRNLRAQVDSAKWRQLVAELQAMPVDTTLGAFLTATERDLEQVYAGPDRSWGRLLRDAKRAAAVPESTRGVHRALYTMLHVDDEERTELYRRWLTADRPPMWEALAVREQRLLDMLLVGLWGTARSRLARVDALDATWSDEPLRAELCELLDVLAERANQVTLGTGHPTIPLRVHARYAKVEGLVGYGKGSYERAPSITPGVYRSDAEGSDFFFVTLRKDEKTFTPQTRYRDYAMSATRFHWETQARTTAASPAAKRYITHQERGDDIGLFVRESTKTPAGSAEPFTYLGGCTYRSHQGSAPVQIVWDLEHRMPATLLEVARLVA